MQHRGNGPTVLDVVTYFLANWQHDDPDDPVRIYEEVSDERYELRKIEEFADGRLIRSGGLAPELTTSLSWEPLPATDEIAATGERSYSSLTCLAVSLISGYRL